MYFGSYVLTHFFPESADESRLVPAPVLLGFSFPAKRARHAEKGSATSMLVEEREKTTASVTTRKHARCIFSVPFQLHQINSSGLHGVHAITLDISEGGLGALVQGKLSVGETVLIDLPMGPGKISAMGVVRHTCAVRSGFEFLRLRDGDRKHIAKLIRSAY